MSDRMALAVPSAFVVIPAQAGIHVDFAFAPEEKPESKMDPGFRQDDEQKQGKKPKQEREQRPERAP